MNSCSPPPLPYPNPSHHHLSFYHCSAYLLTLLPSFFPAVSVSLLISQTPTVAFHISQDKTPNPGTSLVVGCGKIPRAATKNWHSWIHNKYIFLKILNPGHSLWVPTWLPLISSPTFCPKTLPLAHSAPATWCRIILLPGLWTCCSFCLEDFLPISTRGFLLQCLQVSFPPSHLSKKAVPEQPVYNWTTPNNLHLILSSS